MSIQKTNHPTVLLFPGTSGALTAVGGAADNLNSAWIDTSGWTDKKISYVVTGANTDADIIAHLSPMGYSELTDLGTSVSTQHYKAVTITTAIAAQTMGSVDSDDVDDLKRPIRSMRINISNDSATAITAFKVWIEGWS